MKVESKNPRWCVAEQSPRGPYKTFHAVQSFETRAEAEVEKERLSRLPEKAGYHFVVATLPGEKRKTNRGWREGIETLVFILLLVGGRTVYKEGGWDYLLGYAAVLAVVIAVLWFLLGIFKPLAAFVIDEGIVGCWRWLKDRPSTPLCMAVKGRRTGSTVCYLSIPLLWIDTFASPISCHRAS